MMRFYFENVHAMNTLRVVVSLGRNDLCFLVNEVNASMCYENFTIRDRHYVQLQLQW